MHGFDLLDGALNYQHRWQFESHSQTALRTIMLGGQALVTIVAANGGISHERGRCLHGTLASIERRSYIADGYADSHIPGISYSINCELSETLYGATINFARDTPESFRPGGATNRAEISAYVRRQLTPSLTLLATGLYGHYSDNEGYSPLMDANARRTIHRNIERLEFIWRFHPELKNWAATAELERIEDRSNLEIARYTSAKVAAGIRYQF